MADSSSAARDRRLAIEKAIKDGTFGKTPAEKPAPKPAAVKPGPLGAGAAQKAGNAMSGRQRQIDRAVEEAERGTSLSSAKRPRSY